MHQKKKAWNGGKIGTEKVTYTQVATFSSSSPKSHGRRPWKTVQRSWIEQGIGSWHRYKYSTETFSSQNLKQKHHKWSKTGAEIERRKELEQKRRSVHWKQQRGEVEADRFVRFFCAVREQRQQKTRRTRRQEATRDRAGDACSKSLAVI